MGHLLGVLFWLSITSPDQAEPVVPAARIVRQQPLQELFRSEVVYPQEKGEVQLTFVTDFEKFDGGSTVSLPAGFEFGLTGAWQVGAAILPYTRVRLADHVESGRGGVSIGTKYSFMNIRGSGVHAAVGLEAEFQHGPSAEGVVETGHEVESFAVAAIDLPRRAGVFAHVGVISARSPLGEGDPAGRLNWTIGGLIALAHCTLATELSFLNDRGFRRGVGGTYITPSVTLHPRDRWELSAGVPIGLTPRSNSYGLVAHLIYER